MKILLYFFLLMPALVYASPGDPQYPVSAIPAELKENADVVVRDFQMKFTIKGKGSSALTIREVFTILNNQGEDYAKEVVYYDKQRKIISFKGASFDAQGNLIKRLKPSEIYDQSAISGGSLFEDNRLKAANLVHGSYPYTVEFEYEIDYKHLYQIRPFIIQIGERISIEKSQCTILYPLSLKPQYKVLNVNANPVVTPLDHDRESLTWTFEKLTPLKEESFSPKYVEFLPMILFSPTSFEYSGYEGTMDTWQNFGKWIQQLNEGRGELSETTKQKVRELTQGLTSTEEKAKVLYEYMQGKTRYVSIQLGIGGLQPFPAKIVEDNGYGDCKALSNYMVALLQEAGIKGYYTLIYGGQDPKGFPPDFVHDAFNHIVVAIPNKADTLWLECTSQTNPFGYMGSFTGDRRALMITEEGGKLVKTPVYQAEHNIQSVSAEVVVEANGLARVKSTARYSGLQYENGGLNFILNDQFDDQKKWIQRMTDIPSFDIVSYKFKDLRGKIPTAQVDLNLVVTRFANVSGKRMFFVPNLMNRSSFVPEKLEARKNDIVRSVAFIDYDTIRFTVPESIYLEFQPEPTKITSRFGEYESSVKVEQGTVIYYRRLKMNRGRYPASSYQELTDFYKAINKADNAKLVFLSRT
jgi:transglutaminase-like putative cysteine protease